MISKINNIFQRCSKKLWLKYYLKLLQESESMIGHIVKPQKLK